MLITSIKKENTVQQDRIIDSYQGKERGPLLLVLGGIHGNEPAGIQALQELFAMLKKEPQKNPRFSFHGRLVGIRGNLRAIEKNQRFIDKDLNRQWTSGNINRVTSNPITSLDSEDQELRELIDCITTEVTNYQPEEIILLDLHTTTAYGGIFTVVSDDHRSISIGLAMHAPVIKGLLKGISGTSLHYFNTKNFGISTTALCFESGQHNEPMAITRAVSALVSFLRATGAVKPEDFEHRDDFLQKNQAKNLPAMTELITVHPIKQEDNFIMQPGFTNFKKIKKGTLLATDINGNILAPCDGMILMPLYQPQGDDGFFIIKEVKTEINHIKKAAP